MAEMKIKNGPLKLTLKDDRGRVVAALRYPRVRWKSLEIESEDAEIDAVVLGDRRVRLERRVPASEEGTAGTDSGEKAGRAEWDPFREVEFGVRDFLTKAGKAVEDFLEDLNEWSGPISNWDPRARNGEPDGDGESDSAQAGEPASE
jgi:hypothetical protein